jgi:hypothetical protein
LAALLTQHRGGADRRANLAERGAQRRGVGEIAGHEEWTRLALDERIGECGAGFALQVEKRDPGTVLGKGADKGRANAAGAAGNDHRSTFERSVSGKAHRIASLIEVCQAR